MYKRQDVVDASNILSLKGEITKVWAVENSDNTEYHAHFKAKGVVYHCVYFKTDAVAACWNVKVGKCELTIQPICLPVYENGTAKRGHNGAVRRAYINYIVLNHISLEPKEEEPDLTEIPKDYLTGVNSFITGVDESTDKDLGGDKFEKDQNDNNEDNTHKEQTHSDKEFKDYAHNLNDSDDSNNIEKENNEAFIDMLNLLKEETLRVVDEK